MYKISEITSRINRDGVAKVVILSLGWVSSRLRSYIHDKSRGLSTDGSISSQSLGYDNNEFHAYVPTDYAAFKQAMEFVELRPGEDVFVDIGSGKGRIVIAAAQYPFRRAIGVEFSQVLHEHALANLHSAQTSLVSPVEFVRIDAREWAIPNDATVFFFFNPFEGEVLRAVWRNIEHSLEEFPRRATLIYVRSDKFFDKQIDWTRHLRRMAVLPYADGTLSVYETLAG